MFTGLIQGQGELLALSGGAERRLRLRALFPLPDIVDGESIAVNGVCLSVERHDGGEFTAYASAETVARTTLGGLSAGARVNLERALALGDRLGGHLVSGHVDCRAVVRAVAPDGQSLRCRLGFPAEYGPEVIAKGSVCLDGISLTVNACGPDFLEVNIIPDTQARTTMRHWAPGVEVNMETDLVGKYVRGLLAPWRDRPAGTGRGLTRDLLARNGFL